MTPEEQIKKMLGAHNKLLGLYAFIDEMIEGFKADEKLNAETKIKNALDYSQHKEFEVVEWQYGYGTKAFEVPRYLIRMERYGLIKTRLNPTDLELFQFVENVRLEVFVGYSRELNALYFRPKLDVDSEWLDPLLAVNWLIKNWEEKPEVLAFIKNKFSYLERIMYIAGSVGRSPVLDDINKRFERFTQMIIENMPDEV